MKKFTIMLLTLVISLTVICMVSAQDQESLIDNGDGTYSMENGIFLRHYEGYSEEAQLYLSALDACYSIISDYSPVVDDYVNGKKSFDEEQWNTIYSEIKYMNGKACSYVMSNEAPDDLSEHSFDIFFAAYHLMTANELLINAIQNEDSAEAAIASYYYSLADSRLDWWSK
ncbi:MAG: hypothetical protein IJI14_15945 [Anaerolineaceae bacterium]|nr:hypothetical protein [Anaerolineaceae bacterium]